MLKNYYSIKNSAIDSHSICSLNQVLLSGIYIDWLFFPLDVPDNQPSDKREDYICMMPQWIKWKNHHKVKEVLKKLLIKTHPDKCKKLKGIDYDKNITQKTKAALKAHENWLIKFNLK